MVGVVKFSGSSAVVFVSTLSPCTMGAHGMGGCVVTSRGMGGGVVTFRGMGGGCTVPVVVLCTNRLLLYQYTRIV